MMAITSGNHLAMGWPVTELWRLPPLNSHRQKGHYAFVFFCPQKHGPQKMVMACSYYTRVWTFSFQTLALKELLFSGFMLLYQRVFLGKLSQHQNFVWTILRGYGKDGY